LPARFKCGVNIGGKRARRARKVTERKMSNKHLLEAGRYICKGGKVRKVTERKMGNKHLLEAVKAKHVKTGRVRKVTERKMGNTHLLEAWEATLNTTQVGGKRARRRGK
jgi:hypothetical protein